MIAKLTPEKLEESMDLANAKIYEDTLDKLDKWIDNLAVNGPDGLVDVYSEMVEFLKITPKDLAENKENNPKDVLESVDILSAQCGSATIRRPHSKKIKAFILSIVGLGMGGCFHSSSNDLCPQDTVLHSYPEAGHGPNPFR